MWSDSPCRGFHLGVRDAPCGYPLGIAEPEEQGQALPLQNPDHTITVTLVRLTSVKTQG